MLWHGRPNGCGLNLPEEKKLIFGVEGGNIVAYGHHAFPLCTNINQGYVEEAFGLFNLKELSFCHKLKMSNPYIFTI